MINQINNIKDQIKNIACSCGRDPEIIRLVAVSKTKPVSMVKKAIESGADILGENYIQEAVEKIKSLSAYTVSWHFIGHLQTNKAKYAVKFFDLIHTVHSIKLAREINKCANKIDKIQDILVQVNISGEIAKTGVDEEKAETLIKEISLLQNISVKGLMTMPPFFDDPEKARPYFKALFDLKNRINNKAIPDLVLYELSMGMTNDYAVAIEEGSTLVRIGTAIFGKRC